MLEYARLVGGSAIALGAKMVTFSDNIKQALVTVGAKFGKQKVGQTAELE